MDSLVALRSAVSGGRDEFETLADGSPAPLATARVLRLTGDGREFDLDAATAFESHAPEPHAVTLRTVVNCWQLRDKSVPEYIATSDERGVPNLRFLERTDLVEWLEGAAAESEYIRGDGKGDGAALHDAAAADVEMADAVSVERGTLLNHASVLHGQKSINFSSAATMSNRHIVTELRHAAAGRPAAASASAASFATGMPPLKPTKGKDPIILLSPSPSSMLNLANVQDLLERGVYNPVLKSSTSPNLLRITHESKLIGSKVRFVVVDSVAQFKPEYWDRVVAVFVTGQSWQLRQYKWADANSLFHHVLGFALVYKNDPIPESLKQWNVKIEPLDRSARFRDREVVQRIWERIDAHMIARGWPVSHN